MGPIQPVWLLSIWVELHVSNESYPLEMAGDADDADINIFVHTCQARVDGKG